MRDQSGYRALPWYAEILRALHIRKEPMTTPSVGPTLLMVAAEHGDTGSVEALLNHKADVNERGRGVDWNPDHCDGRDYKALNVLLEWEADGTTDPAVDFDEPSQRTALLESMSLGAHTSVATLQALLSHGADPNAHDHCGATPLLLAMTMQEHRPETVTLLVRDGADVNRKDKAGQTPLMFAAAMGDSPLVRLLLKLGANAKAKDRDGDTALDETDPGQGDPTLRPLLKRAGATETPSASDTLHPMDFVRRASF